MTDSQIPPQTGNKTGFFSKVFNRAVCGEYLSDALVIAGIALTFNKTAVACLAAFVALGVPMIYLVKRDMDKFEREVQEKLPEIPEPPALQQPYRAHGPYAKDSKNAEKKKALRMSRYIRSTRSHSPKKPVN